MEACRTGKCDCHAANSKNCIECQKLINDKNIVCAECQEILDGNN